MPDIVKKLTIKTGKNAGQHPSVASLYRALADTDASPGTTRPLGSFLPYPGGPRQTRPGIAPDRGEKLNPGLVH